MINMLFVAGSVDDVSGYENGIRAIWEKAINTDRSLLTYDNANHNAGAPIPAPAESWQPSEHIDFIPFDHYADAVWDNVRMNNVLPGFIDSLPEKEEFRARIPMGRYGKSSEEIAAVVAFLASEGGGYITGQNIRVDGGISRSV